MLPSRSSWLFLAGLVSFCVFLILTIIGGPRLPTTLTMDELIDPATGQPRTPEEQGRMIQRKILKSQAFELLISAFVFLAIACITCGLPFCLTGCQRRGQVAPSVPTTWQPRSDRVAPSGPTSPPQMNSPSTIDELNETCFPIVLSSQIQATSSLPQG